MTLKQKSILTSVITTVIFVFCLSGILYGVLLNRFQAIENQRVDRNIKRISAIFEDRFLQMDAIMRNWSTWDDTYFFLQNHNQKYIDVNLTQASFGSTGIDEALFIDKNGALITSFLSQNLNHEYEKDFPHGIYSHFATGSALLKTDKQLGYAKGVIKTNEGVLLYIAQDVLQSNGLGQPDGSLVTCKYIDQKMLNSVKELTQFDAWIYLWNDPNLPVDYLPIKANYTNGIKQLTRPLSNNTISGYQVIEDVYGKPQAIVRTDIERDISIQGKSSMLLLLVIFTFTSTLSAGLNYWLLTGNVLKKISLMTTDVDVISHSPIAHTRLNVGTVSDEVDKLRSEINEMLDSLQKSQSALDIEKQRGASLFDLIDSIIVSLDTSGNVLSINQYGLDTMGYTKEEVIGKDWFVNFVPSSALQAVTPRFKEIVSGKLEGNTVVENEVLCKNKESILVSWHTSIIKDINGKVISTISIGEDITKEKKELQKRANYAKELEKLNNLMVDREQKMIELKRELSKYRQLT